MGEEEDLATYPADIAYALRDAFNDLKSKYGWTDEEIMEHILRDWLIGHGYLQHDESTDIELPKGK